jgi:hypothetical protein
VERRVTRLVGNSLRVHRCAKPLRGEFRDFLLFIWKM